MKRKLKFRAWDETHKIMHHNFQFIKSGDEGNDWIVFTSDKQKLTDKPHPLENPYFSQQLKVMQFTGLHDKNGKEIFEGDIFKIQYYINYGFAGIHPKEIIALITFENGGFWFSGDGYTDCNWHLYDAKDREVIGNFYENPELINPKS